MTRGTAPTGRAWKLPADVDTDQLAPGATMKHGIEVTARHCLEALRPEFASGVQRGDLIVAGPHFGIGSSREQAARVLVHLGVTAGKDGVVSVYRTNGKQIRVIYARPFQPEERFFYQRKVDQTLSQSQ